MSNRPLFNACLAIVSLLVLTACGGGGGGNTSESTPPELIQQTLSFSSPGPIDIYIGDSISNEAIGQGSGAVTYSSSDHFVAKVDTQGKVTGIAEGSAVITAKKAADSKYSSIDATYRIRVHLIPNTLNLAQKGTITIPVGTTRINAASGLGSGVINYTSSNEEVVKAGSQGEITAMTWGEVTINVQQEPDSRVSGANTSYRVRTTVPMNAWVGIYDSIVSFPPQASGLEFYRSTEKNCDFSSYSSCEQGQLTILGDQIVKDTTFTLTQPAFYNLSDGTQAATISTGAQHFSPRYEQEVIEFKGKLWLIGGNYNSDIWSSTDGITWTLEAEDAGFPGGLAPKVVLHNSKLWMITGATYLGKSEVWSSEDGVNWLQEMDSPPFSSRSNHQLVSFNGKIWLVGGYDQSLDSNSLFIRKGDIWSSPDGINWRKITDTAPFPARSHHQLTVFSNRLWLSGGIGNGGEYYGDIWSSVDGVNWEKIEHDMRNPARYGHALITYKQRLWIIGGNNGGSSSDVWSSPDGKHWTAETPEAAFPSRSGHKVISYDGKVILIAGWDGNSMNDIWSSNNGVNWNLEFNESPFPALSHHKMISHDNKLWLFGSDSFDKNVWVSTDGSEWNLLTTTPEFSARTDYQVVSHNGKIWIVGGWDGKKYLNDVWSSDNGINWSLVTDNASFMPRGHHQAVSHNGKLWVIGGASSQGTGVQYRNDVWSSDDGIYWIRETGAADFSPRHSHQVVSHNNKLWLVGGYDNSDNIKNDVWQSGDGKSWDKLADASFGPRQHHQVASHAGKLWLVGGLDDSLSSKNDIWSSADGIQWTKINSNAEFTPRTYHQVVSFNGNLLLSGGCDSHCRNDLWRSEDGQYWRKLYRREFVHPDSE